MIYNYFYSGHVFFIIKKNKVISIVVRNLWVVVTSQLSMFEKVLPVVSVRETGLGVVLMTWECNAQETIRWGLSHTGFLWVVLDVFCSFKLLALAMDISVSKRGITFFSLHFHPPPSVIVKVAVLQMLVLWRKWLTTILPLYLYEFALFTIWLLLLVLYLSS